MTHCWFNASPMTHYWLNGRPMTHCWFHTHPVDIVPQYWISFKQEIILQENLRTFSKCVRARDVRPCTEYRVSFSTLQLWELLFILRFETTPHLFYAKEPKHMCDSWIKRDQLDATCFIVSLFNAQHVSDVNTSILRSLRLICWVISWVVLLWFDVCWCYVVVWLWWCGIRMQAEACIRIPHHHSHTTT